MIMKNIQTSLFGKEIESLKIMTFNCRGLKNKTKRLSLFKTFRDKNIDVVCLQETYLMEREKKTIETEWGNKVLLSEGTSKSKGLIILFGNKISESSTIEMIDSNSRIIISKLENDNSSILIVNIYAPCNIVEKINFFSDTCAKIQTVIKQNPDCPLVCVGDFNTVLNNDLDIISGEKHNEKVLSEFKTFISQLSLVDTWREENKSDKAFTWCRKNPSIARRLDYILLDEDLLVNKRKTVIQTLGFSDHSAVTTHIKFNNFKRGISSFKLNTALLRDNTYVELIKGRIKRIEEDLSNEDAQLRWEMIKLEIKTTSKEYSRFKKMKTDKDHESYAQELKCIEEQYKLNPNDEKTLETMTNIKKKLEIKKIADTNAARIRAGIKWIEEGEKCNKYFLSLEKSRAAHNTVYRIRDSNGETKTNEIDILTTIKDYYENLYRETIDTERIEENSDKFVSELDIPTLNQRERDMCDQDITEAELLAAIKVMKNGSSPGSDGIPVEFYKMFWNQIKSPLLDNFKLSFAKGELSYSQRKGIISQIHKGKGLDREDMNNWRPISLTNVDYKILAKVLAMRLSRVIKTLVSNDQKGFIKGRNISHILREIDDLVENEKNENRDSLLLAIDYRKAFDSVSRNFLCKIFEYFGFGDNFKKWIMILLNKRIACVKNGGHISTDFCMNRGIRQGCPISPMIFVLAVEILALRIKQSDIKGVVLKDKRFVIKQYADDTTLLLSDENDLKKALDLIDHFASFSGLYINESKTHCMIMGGNHRGIKDIAGINVVNEIKILGVFFNDAICAMDNEKNWLKRIEVIKSIIIKWQKRNLSLIGKIHVIKTFLLSQLIFIMQSISLPETVLEEVNRIFFKFLWKKKYNNKKAFEKVKRRVMTNDFNQGGLNMIDIKAMQNSFLIQWGQYYLSDEERDWKVFPDNFFSKVGGAYAFEASVKDHISNSYITNMFWKKVLKTWIDAPMHETDEQGVVYLSDNVFNNANIVYKGKSIFSPKLIKLGIRYVCDVFRDDKIMTIEEIINKYGFYNGIQLDYNVMVNGISKSTIDFRERGENTSNRKVKFLKTLTRKKIYLELVQGGNIDNVKNFWLKKLDVSITEKHWGLIWECTQETRLRVLQWKIIHNVYPTNILLQKMGYAQSQSCSTCSVTDFSEHFFFFCKQVRPIWQEVERKINAKTGKHLKLKVNDVMLGITQIEQTDKSTFTWINHMILVAKMVISKMKYGPKRFPLEILDLDLRLRRLI